MSKFSVGDRVVVVNRQTVFTARHGEVIGFKDAQDFPIKVLFDGDCMEVCFTGDELEFEHVYDGLSAKPAEQSSSYPAVEVGKRPDAVDHPSHYTWLPNGIEVIDVTAAFPFVRGNALKYLLRADHKGRKLEDLKKARWYLDYEIQQLEKESGNADS
jgi:hypothetical protein